MNDRVPDPAAGGAPRAAGALPQEAPDDTPGGSWSPAASQWLNRYHALGASFHTELGACALPQAHWIAVNPQATRMLGWPQDWWRTPEALAVFSGAALWPGMRPLATVYSGHQFGVWAGQLGDGRALMLGEVQTPHGSLEVQLKGSGLTPYSRMGDGRAVLRSSIREYLCSHAMQALGVPTTLALCLVGSPEPVLRERVESAAMVTRLAPSFVRFGHFEHFAHGGQHEALKSLADHVIGAHLPHLADRPQPYLALLDHAVRSTAQLLAHWQALGFCHGVMNMDNMSILGLTLDYGPFGFLDAYDPLHVCNHSDTHGRYAFARQPGIAFWNLCALGQAMLPLIGDAQAVVGAIEGFKAAFGEAIMAAMRAKLGLAAALPQDVALIEGWLNLLRQQQADHTLAFRALGELDVQARGPLPPLDVGDMAAVFSDREALASWLRTYQERLQHEPGSADARRERCRRHNPRFILRNHLAQAAIERAERGDFSEVDRLMRVLSAPYDDQPGEDDYARVPPPWARHIEVSCSS
jgi:uncharacterized protein YdiU (UPF0061 family)